MVKLRKEISPSRKRARRKGDPFELSVEDENTTGGASPIVCRIIDLATDQSLVLPRIAKDGQCAIEAENRSDRRAAVWLQITHNRSVFDDPLRFVVPAGETRRLPELLIRPDDNTLLMTFKCALDPVGNNTLRVFTTSYSVDIISVHIDLFISPSLVPDAHNEF